MLGLAANIPPQEAQSNLAAWAELLGLNYLANLITPTINDIIFWLVIIGLTVYIFWFCILPLWKHKIREEELKKECSLEAKSISAKFTISKPTVTLGLPPWNKPCLRIKAMWTYWGKGYYKKNNDMGVTIE